VRVGFALVIGVPVGAGRAGVWVGSTLGVGVAPAGALVGWMRGVAVGAAWGVWVGWAGG
jgi:hypothetical protein